MDNFVVNNVTIKVIFNREKKIEKGAETASITIRVYVPKGGGTTHIETGVKVDKFNFQDKHKHWVKPNYPNATASNLKILNIYDKIYRKVVDCDLKGEIFTLDMIRINSETPKTVPKTRKTDNTCFLAFFEKEIKSRDVRESSKETYGTVFRVLKKHYDSLPFSKINYNFMKEFDLKLQGDNVANNGRLNYFRILKVFIAEATNCEFISIETLHQINRFKIKKEATKRKEVSINEIALLENFKTDKPKVEIACDFFLFAVYTGLAYSDASNLFKTEVLVLPEYGWVIQRKRQKTNEVSTIPISLIFEGKAIKIIEKYQNSDNTFCFPDITRKKDTFKYYLESLFKTLNMRNYTMHCARHTFAAYCINNGLDKGLLQKMLGHTQSSTTDIYAKVNIGGIVEGLKKMSN